uniref:Uncharacterized protein n=1 Tax=Anguilla anguilla TaxID=7936 RepID=A0A0E9RJV6_ANGAN
MICSHSRFVLMLILNHSEEFCNVSSRIYSVFLFFVLVFFSAYAANATVCLFDTFKLS